MSGPGAGARSWAAVARWGRLPRRARWLAVALLACATVPAAAALIAFQGGSTLATAASAYAEPLQAAAAALAALAILAFEPPRSASPLAYLRQLRARFLLIQSAFDADVRRHPWEGKEKEHDRSPTEPQARP